MIILVVNVYLNLPPLIKVRAFIQKNGKYIYHLVRGMIPNFLRTCFSWDSIKLFSDGTLFLPLRFVLMTKTLPPKDLEHLKRVVQCGNNNHLNLEVSL